MKLIRCCIDNFGKLSNYKHEFTDGLNVIQESNGFGKSTLAAFIKAMFYGLPRTGARNVVENERRRYEPWQGGNYGGWLEFEYNGNAYRITRRFGQMASKDLFELWNVTKRTRSNRFSEKIGQELFQLDAEAFARSTYLSSEDHSSFANTSIRTKLSNLVDNTNDLNNYDTAVNRLKQRSSSLSSTRGKGGKIQDLDSRIEYLERTVFEEEVKISRLAEIEKDIDEKKHSLELKNGGINHLREKILSAASQQARLNQKKHFLSLQKDVKDCQVQLNELDKRYPNGYPGTDEINQQRANLILWNQADEKQNGLVLQEKDRITVEKEDHLFKDTDRVKQDMDHCQQICNEYEQTAARLNAQMLPEEIERLRELSARFRDGIPTEEELQTYRNLADSWKAKELQIAALQRHASDQTYYIKLETMFQTDEPSDEQIAECEKQQQEIAGLEERKRAGTFTEAEKADWEEMSRTFASGEPTAEEIQNQQQSFRRITELNGIKRTQTAVVKETDEPTSFLTTKGPIVLVVLGAMLLIAGIVFLVQKMITPGAIFLGAGLAILLGGFWLRMKAIEQARGSTQSVITGSAITDEENQELNRLQDGLTEFLLRFFNDTDHPDEKLTKLTLDREKYLSLLSKKESGELEAKRIDQEIRKREQAIHALFEKYYPDTSYWDGFTNDLMLKHNDFVNERRHQTQIDEDRKRLTAEITDCHIQLESVLSQYYPADAFDYRTGVQTLASEMQEYQQLQSKKQAMVLGKESMNAKVRELEESIQTILKAYAAWPGSGSYTTCLQTLRNRFHDYQAASFRVSQYREERDTAKQTKETAEKALDSFFRKYRLAGSSPEEMIQRADDDVRLRSDYIARSQDAQRKLDAFLAENTECVAEEAEVSEENIDLDGLKLAEKTMQEQSDAIQNDLRELRQERDVLRRIAEDLPTLTDTIAKLKEEKRKAEYDCRIINQAVSFLEAAKDGLADSYVGKVEQNFQRFANELLGDQLGETMLDKDLQLYIEACGKNREINSFSSGTVEGIVICMRMALVEAMFGQEQPFIILDDPFISLDDEKTVRALNMLNRLAEKYQIIYLVCNSSRC